VAFNCIEVWYLQEKKYRCFIKYLLTAYRLTHRRGIGTRASQVVALLSSSSRADKLTKKGVPSGMSSLEQDGGSDEKGIPKKKNSEGVGGRLGED